MWICDRGRRHNPTAPLQVEAPVYLTAVADSRDGDHAGAVVNGIDHPVVTRPYAQVWPVAGQGREASWARIDGKSVDNLGDRLTDRRVELAQRAAGTRPDINAVGGHAEPARLEIQLGLDLLPGNRLTRIVHGGVGLGGVLSVLGSAESVDD
jgi:hypothetical protein